jgi:DNA-binding transcriptional LysR family regulator
MHHDLTSLRLFVTVAECGNLTRAAEREHLAVSAVSKRISELEEMTGTLLLQRQARGVSLTPAGQTMLKHARQILKMIQCMDAELDDYGHGIKGTVRLYVVASALTQFLPEELEGFLAMYPMVNIELVEQTGRAIALAVADGSADIGVVATQTPTSGLTTYPYHQDTLMVGLPLGHPLSKKKTLRFLELAKYPFIGPHAGSSLSDLLLQAAKDCGVNLQQRVQASSFDAMCRLVETRLGITILPKNVLAPYVSANRIAVSTLKEAWASRQMLLAVKDSDLLSPVAKTLLEYLTRIESKST